MHRIIGWRVALAASAAITAFGGAPAALAQAGAPVQGDWIGTLTNPAGPITMAIHLATSVKGQAATIGVVEFGSRGAPLTNVSVTGSKLHFDDPDAHGQYDGSWDEAGHRWNGAWTGPAGPTPLILSPGLPPPLPRIEGLDGDWQGGIDAGAAGVVHLALHIRTGSDGTTATLDSPDQGTLGLPVLVARDGRTIKLNMAIIAARYQAELSDDGASMKGNFSRGQIPLPLVFTRSSQAKQPGRPD